MIYTVEDTSLAAAFDHSGRRAAIKDMTAQLGLIEDAELKAQVSRLVEKLKQMNDEEFAKIDFSVYEEDYYE